MKLSLCRNVSTSVKIRGLVSPTLTFSGYEGSVEHYEEVQLQKKKKTTRLGSGRKGMRILVEPVSWTIKQNNKTKHVQDMTKYPMILSKQLTQIMLLKCFKLKPYSSLSLILLKGKFWHNYSSQSCYWAIPHPLSNLLTSKSWLISQVGVKRASAARCDGDTFRLVIKR